MVYNGEISAEQKALAIYFKAGIWNIIQRDVIFQNRLR